jgi:VanZ family protein
MAAMLTPGRSARPRAWALAATVAVAVLLLVPVPAPPDLAPGLAALPLDKLAHAALFLVLVGLWRRATTLGAASLVALAVAYGGLLELAQSGLGSRSGEWGDLAADAAGALAAVLLPGARRPAVVDGRAPLA